jgi:hypothetical protein
MKTTLEKLIAAFRGALFTAWAEDPDMPELTDVQERYAELEENLTETALVSLHNELCIEWAFLPNRMEWLAPKIEKVTCSQVEYTERVLFGNPLPKAVTGAHELPFAEMLPYERNQRAMAEEAGPSFWEGVCEAARALGYTSHWSGGGATVLAEKLCALKSFRAMVTSSDMIKDALSALEGTEVIPKLDDDEFSLVVTLIHEVLFGGGAS